MLLRCFRAEMRKLRGSAVWLVFFAVPLIPAGYGTFNYLQNQGILSEGWYSLFTQHTLFYAMFFFAPMVGVYVGYLWRLEHRGGGVAGMLLCSRDMGLIWPYALMLLGMNSNRSEDVLAGGLCRYLLACAGFTLLFGLLAAALLRRRDVRA